MRPLAFGDSEPGTHWLALPVSYREGEEATRVTVGQVNSMRTVAVGPDEELRRHDGRKAPGEDDLDLERPPATPAEPAATGRLRSAIRRRVRQERAGDTPEVLYRDSGSLTAGIDQEIVLPYGARDLNPLPGLPPLDLGDGTVLPGEPGLDLSRAFGDLELSLRFDEARLHYGVQTSPFENPELHTASGPARALLYLTTSELTWDDEVPHFGSMGTEGVLVLEDGTEIAATRLVETDNDFMSGGVLDPEASLGPGTSVFDGLVWDVPADIESATAKITFRSIKEGELWELDFQDAVVELDLEFPSPDRASR